MNARALALAAGFALAGLPLAASSVDLGNLFNTVKQAVKPADQDQEAEIGRDAAATLLGATKPIHEAEVQQYVNRIGLWVAMHSDRPDLPWRFAVLDSDDIDAFAAPGGYVFITRGLLLRMHNEAELAGVLGHEISHVVLKHHLNELMRAARLDLLGQAASYEMQQQGHDTKVLDKVAGASRTLYSKGLDKDDEFDADRFGVVLAARAGYDPYGLLSVLQTLESVDPKSSSMQLLMATHPSPADRIAALSASMKSGRMERFGNQPEGQGRFERIVKKLVLPAQAGKDDDEDDKEKK
ncbi:MAG TPA: M48 family metallopeptidase [Gammaproteobacteria bacterium]|nr:M48 family metallopeptidase [Gammaproteobacteria bacterium]